MRDLSLAVAAPSVITAANASIVPVLACVLAEHHQAIDVDLLTGCVLTAIPLKLAHETIWFALASWLARRKVVVLGSAVVLAFLLQFVTFTPEGAEPSTMPWFIDYYFYATPLVAGAVVVLVLRVMQRAKGQVSAGA